MISIPLQAHNHANVQETEKLHLKNKATFNFSEIFQNFDYLPFCV